MSVVFLGYHEMGCMGLRTLLRLGVPVRAVFTYEDDPDENCWFGSVAALAREASLPTFTPEKINAPEWVEQIDSLAPDLILSVYYRHIVGKKIRAIPARGAVNLHGSLLPKYRGRAPLNWQIVCGEKRAGVTLHHMVARADAGDVVDSEAVDVGSDETAIELYRKLAAAGERVLERRIPELLAGTAPRIPQDDAEATLFGGRTPEDGRIDWRWPAQQIHDLVRAVTEPWPGAFCDTAHGRVTVWRTRLLDGQPARAEPGAVELPAGAPLRVRAGDRWLEILKVEAPEGALVDGASVLDVSQGGAL